MIHISRAGDGRVSVSVDANVFLRCHSVFINTKFNIASLYGLENEEIGVIKFDTFEIDDTGLKCSQLGPDAWTVKP